MSEQLLPSLGLVRRAGKLIYGFDAVQAACKDQTARLVLTAADLSQKSRKEIVRTAQMYAVPHACLLYTSRRGSGVRFSSSPPAFVKQTRAFT